MDDGQFLVATLGAVTRRTLARMAPTLPRAGHLDHPALALHVALHIARAVGLDAPGTVAYADGERIGPLLVRSGCVAAALPVLVPPGITPEA